MVNLFWKDLEKLLNEKCIHFVNLVLSDTLIFFGIEENFRTDAVFDLILLWAKLYIYLNQRHNIIPNVHGFIEALRGHYRVCRCAATDIDELNKFEQGWVLYRPLLV